MPADILIVDDEADIRELIAGILEDEGHATRVARDSDEALRSIEERRPQLIILDIWLQGSRLDGLEVLSIIKRTYPELPVVIISGHGNIETAVTAIKRGAYDYIEKPFKADRLILVTLRALEAYQLRREVKELRERSTVSAEMIGKSVAVNQLRNQLEKVAPTNSRIMIRGASGTGKELSARVIHMKSHRAEGPFVVLNAAAMAPERVEEELFGTEDRVGGPRKVGALEEAHGGTLYIDEVADMPLETQGKVLRVLVEQKFLRLGGSQKVAVDVRIISSTSRDLDLEMREGRFREDLYHRLSVVPLRVPSLAERRDDIPELINYFIAQLAQASGLAPRRIGEDAIAVLQAHDWPGNVRELRNNIERLMILAGGDPNTVITSDMLPEEIGSNVPLPVNGGAEHLMSLPLREAREIFEREYLLAQINRFGGNISRTAEFVGMERSALHRKLRALGVSSDQRSSEARAS
ncbi:Nitrogen assimilation regulatory protein NtrX [Candidatus Filomicrobium marinum]|uniref:Nitrogen assimilation regulatory protein NtrX n=2 Tax=Filomicrobium TaxID=119044 RepID=A0A0D6JIC2_9HYPH|nr:MULTISPECIES: sigma-54 dependent transcriptional regulator [Filomicrobium]MCV0371550.1 sigma-54 dependent transcriptional regulator [Filomicrobium sp.]CFX37690.1 Nitrogen assimilation regulatory protein NtrX [Candidatus Filomicrobium marinum]CPR21597.1 Nitrogen assimilation regulatory protein NtrX [Candidatus Filomicrobium marinum]SDP62034.1 two-component system, NtrC family, nitrogen regulation response regulator NtrX [Filomicrobium insigne]